mgnify:CR=1 FL=1
MNWTPGQTINIFITDYEYKEYIQYVLYYHAQPYISMKLNFVDSGINSDLIIYVVDDYSSGGSSTNGNQKHGFMILNSKNLAFGNTNVEDVEKPSSESNTREFNWARYTILREFANVLNLRNINQNSCQYENACDPHDPYSILNIPSNSYDPDSPFNKFNRSPHTLDTYSPEDIEWLLQYYGNQYDSYEDIDW